MTSRVERFVTANHLRHHVVERPREGAPTVVLLHGYLDHARSFARVIDALGDAGYAVVAPDLRGHGDTDPTPPGSYYHFCDYLADVDALLDALKLDAVYLVGHSMGGGVASRYAGARPSRVRALAVLEGLGPPAMAAEIAVDRTVGWLDQLVKMRGRSPRKMATLDEVAARMRVSHPELPTETLRAVAEDAVRPHPDGGWVFRFDPLHQTMSPMRFDAEAAEAFLPCIACPVLLVDGGAMTAWPGLDARAQRYPNARHVELPGAGHMMHWTQPDALSRALVTFLDGVRGSAP